MKHIDSTKGNSDISVSTILSIISIVIIIGGGVLTAWLQLSTEQVKISTELHKFEEIEHKDITTINDALSEHKAMIKDLEAHVDSMEDSISSLHRKLYSKK